MFTIFVLENGERLIVRTLDILAQVGYVLYVKDVDSEVGMYDLHPEKPQFVQHS